jgi:hypothetical protein
MSIKPAHYFKQPLAYFVPANDLDSTTSMKMFPPMPQMVSFGHCHKLRLSIKKKVANKTLMWWKLDFLI